MNVLRLAIFVAIVSLPMACSHLSAQETKSLTTVNQKASIAKVKKVTPNLYADDVEACVEFWTERLHFEKTMEVKADNGLAFASLRKGNIELMYGSYASLEVDAATARAYRRGTSTLFIEVEDVKVTFAAMRGAHLISDIHKTFYGSTEFTVTDPAGHLLTFAQLAQ